MKIIGLVLASLLGSCSKGDKTREVVSPIATTQNSIAGDVRIVRKVPVLEYVVKSGDIPIRLIQRELEGSRDFSIPGYGEPRSTQDNVRMYGDEDSRSLVSYFFTVPQILESLNGDRSMQRGYWQPHEYPLMVGERLRVPDFNLDGKINDISGKAKGFLKFDCSRNGTHATKKELRYISEQK